MEHILHTLTYGLEVYWYWVIINTSIIMLFITGGEDAWIGFNDIQDESLYNWADGRQVNYTNWGLHQPDRIRHLGLDCVTMQSQVSI